MTKDNTGACIICKKSLKYLEHAEKMTCGICKKEFLSNACCESGHFVCDDCHSSPAAAVIRYVCLSATSKDPIEIADEIMAFDAIHTHGPEYHILVGSALITAYKNAGGEIDLDSALTTMEHRGKMIPGGFCGFFGACGAGISAGVFLSVALKTNPLSKKSWALGNRLTSECLSEISKYGGPRCCKRDLFCSIKTAVKFVEEHLKVKMELPLVIVCKFSELNHECLKDECPYYQKK